MAKLIGIHRIKQEGSVFVIVILINMLQVIIQKRMFTSLVRPVFCHNQYVSSKCLVHVLVSPYLCFISLLSLDLYVLGDDAWINYGLSCKPNIYVS